MGEILSYFFRPEESVSTLLIERDRNKWKQGLLYWIMLVVLLGFSTMAMYRLSGIGTSEILSEILETDFAGLMQSTS